jgi:hypothetical protein
MDLREIGLGGVDWIRLSQDRDRWRAVVSAVMNLRVLAPRSWLVRSRYSQHHSPGCLSLLFHGTSWEHFLSAKELRQDIKTATRGARQQ